MNLPDPPKDPSENRFYRDWLLRWADTVEKQAAVLERCGADVVYWVDSFAWQYNPRSAGEFTPKTGPFVTWPFQEDALHKIKDCIRTGKDLVIEKSRDMGVSWLCMFALAHDFFFREWMKFLVISRNEDAVDNPGDSDSLFWKLDYLFQRLPDWMMRCDRVKARRKMGFWHPVNHCGITGQATTGKAGVGGACDAMFIDEASQIKEMYEVLHRTSDTTACRIFNGTHAPGGLAFAEITDRETVVGAFIQKLQLHWIEHPDKRKGLYQYDVVKNKIDVLDAGYVYPEGFEFEYSEKPTGGPNPGLRSPWYDAQVKRKGSERAVAQDLDIDRGGGSERFFDAILIRELRHTFACDPVWKGDLLFDPDTGRPLKLVQGDGPLWLWLTPTGYDSVPPGDYALGCDVSVGRGVTNSVCSIGDASTGQKVAELARCDLYPDKFAAVVVSLGYLFQTTDGTPALLNWENHGPGHLFGDTAKGMGYRRLLTRDGVGSNWKGGMGIITEGWVPTPKSKRFLLESYLAALKGRLFINRCDLALKECDMYRWAANRDAVEHPHDVEAEDPSKARSNHGDRAMADALLWMAMQRLGAGLPPSRRPEPPPSYDHRSLIGRRNRRERQRVEEEAWA